MSSLLDDKFSEKLMYAKTRLKCNIFLIFRDLPCGQKRVKNAWPLTISMTLFAVTQRWTGKSLFWSPRNTGFQALWTHPAAKREMNKKLHLGTFDTLKEADSRYREALKDAIEILEY